MRCTNSSRNCRALVPEGGICHQHTRKALHKFFMQSSPAGVSPGLLALDLAGQRPLTWWASSAPAALPWVAADAACDPGDHVTGLRARALGARQAARAG